MLNEMNPAVQHDPNYFLDQDAHDAHIYDVIGIGLGPANLGIAAAIEEYHLNNRDQSDCTSTINSLFLEKKPYFTWHPGMMLPGASMQISFLKDLVTQRNPQSPFSFLAYLHAQGRLNDFINYQTFFPSRLEFSDYLSWVTRQLTVPIRFNSYVEKIDILEDSPARYRIHITENTIKRTYLTHNVISGMGIKPKLPGWAEFSPALNTRVFHNYRLLDYVQDLPRKVNNRMLVIGSGQSAAEVIQYFYENDSQIIIDCAINSYGMVPADDSPFANRVFDPQAVDDFFFAPDSVRAELLSRHRSTNYSCVSTELLQELYAQEYLGKVSGNRRIYFLPATELVDVEEQSHGIRVRFNNRLTNTENNEQYDYIICATGFSSHNPLSLIAGTTADISDFTVNRDYQCMWNDQILSGFYVQGPTEKTHGLSSILLSNIAIRSQEILNSILAERALLTV